MEAQEPVLERPSVLSTGTFKASVDLKQADLRDSNLTEQTMMFDILQKLQLENEPT